ncbi:MAG: phosphatidate cytidylyltransferase, partial [Marinilabiliaceae bacterium]
FFSIVINPEAFRWLAVVIMAGGLAELFKLFSRSGFAHKIYFSAALLIFLVLSTGFYFFSELSWQLILFSFLVLSIFDSFSQITGQLWGRKKILPAISPEKTWGGFIGGSVIAVASALLLNGLYEGPPGKALLMGGGIVLFAFLGDLGASYFKRKYHTKDYSSLIPGHGGILDRFDSLIAGGSWVAMSIYFFNF